MEKEQLIELIHTVSSSNLTEFQYEENGMKISMKRECQVVYAGEKELPAPQINVEEIQKTEEAQEGKLVTSVLVGTFLYSAFRRCRTVCACRRYSNKRTDFGDCGSNETDE